MTGNGTLRYAIIGCGVIGPVHADAVQRLPEAELVATCDIVAERAEKCAETYGGRPYVDFRDMIESERPDAVSVCTPHHTHAELAVGCLKLGVPVLCEKPLGISAESMDRMLRAGESTGCAFGGVFQHRFDPVALTMKRAVEAGTFGRPLNVGAFIRCRRTPDYYAAGEWRGTWAGEGGAVLINQAIHSIDTAQWLAGRVRRVWGCWSNLALADCIEAEDTAAAVLEFESGAIGTIEATSASHLDFAAGVHFYGTEGSFRITTGWPNEVDLLELRSDGGAQELRAALRAAEDEERPSDAAKDCYGSSHGRQLEDFVHAVRDGRPPTVTARSARHAVDIVLGVYASARGGGPVEMP